MNVKQTYEAELAARGYTADPAQLRAVVALERCAHEWAAFKEQRSNAFKKLINRHGKIVSRRKTGCTAASQHAVTTAIKRARFMALLPYVGE